MFILFRQKILVYIMFCKMFSKVESGLIKRSPLELGFVTFPEIEKPRRASLFNKTKPEMNSEENRLDLSAPVTSRITHSHKWIPGRVKHHAYFPAHLHHIFIPLLIPVNSLTSLPLEFYPKHFGGFGIGSHTGGQGAGHGFQIVFNN